MSPFCNSSHLRPTLLPTVSIHVDTGDTASAPMPGIDAGGGRPEDKLRLARFAERVLLADAIGELELGVVGESGSGEVTNAAGWSRDFRRWSFDALSALAGDISMLPRSSSSTLRNGSSNASDDADDCDSRVLVECDDVVPAVDTDDVLCVFTWPCARVTDTREMDAIPPGEPSGEELGAEARSMPRFTIRSHLRFSCTRSASCIASCDRSSRHFDSF